NSSVRLADLNYGLFFHLRGEKDIHIPQLCHRYGKCAEGTMTEEDVVLRESSNKKYGMKKYKSFPFPKSEEHGKNKYYGTKVTINVWEPKIQQQYKFTFSQIWLLSDLFRKYLNSIKACWQPDLYGDKLTTIQRLFTYWTVAS
ncbi:hypothetical protein HID58_057620, partial [Brassica napus]